MSSRAVSKASTWAACLLVGLGVGIGACSSSHPPARSVQAIHVYGSARNRIRIAPSSAQDRSAITSADAARLMNRPVIAALETRHRVLFGLARVTLHFERRMRDAETRGQHRLQGVHAALRVVQRPAVAGEHDVG